MSLESFQEDHLKSREDTPDWRNPILEREGDIHVQQFLEQLSPRDRDILELRMDDYMLKEIAEELGYANHSAMDKRYARPEEVATAVLYLASEVSSHTAGVGMHVDCKVHPSC